MINNYNINIINI